MSNNNSPIRRIPKGENKRVWPDKRLRASGNPSPIPKPGQKSKIESILTALPLLMLIIGLTVYFRGESAQRDGTLIAAESSVLAGQFKHISSTVSGMSKQHYLWLTTEKRDRGVRLSAEQAKQLEHLQEGDVVELLVAPTVSGSSKMWLVEVSSTSDNPTRIDEN